MKKKFYYCLTVICISSAAYAQDADLFWKNGHETPIISASISPDNKFFVTVERDTLAIVWDVASGQQIRNIKNVEAARFRDNNSIYVAMNDKTFKLVDLAGQTITRYNTKTTIFKYGFRFDEMPRLLYPEEGYYFCGNDVFDINKGWLQNVRDPDAMGYDGKAYSPKTKQIALSNKKTRKVYLVNFLSGQKVTEFQTPEIKDNNSNEIEPGFSPDGQQLLISNDKYLQLIDLAGGKIMWTIKHSSKLRGRDAQFSPDGKKIIFQLRNDLTTRIVLVNAASGTVIWTKDYSNGGTRLKRARFSPNGESLCLWLTNWGIENVHLVNVKTGAVAWTLKHKDFKTSLNEAVLEFSPDGQKLLVGSKVTLLFVNTATGKADQAFIQKSQGHIDGIYFADNNKQLIAQANKHLFGWNLLTGSMDLIVPDKEEIVHGGDNHFAPAPDGKSFFVIRNDLLREIDLSGKTIHQFVSPKNLSYRTEAKVSFDGRYVMNRATSSDIKCGNDWDGTVLEVFDTKTHRRVFSKTCVSENVAFMRTKNVVVTQGIDSEHLNFYELPSGKLLYQLTVPPLNFLSNVLFFTADDRYLVTYSGARAYIFDLESRQPVIIPVNVPAATNSMDKTASLRPVGLSADERYLVLYAWRSNIFAFFEIKEQKIDESLMVEKVGNYRSYTFMQVSPIGNFILLGTYQGTILLYDFKQKQIRGRLYPDAAKRNWAVIASDGSFDGNDGAQANMFHVTGNSVVPISAVFEQFYKPRLLPRILNGETFDPTPVDVNKLKNAPEVKIKFKKGTRNLEIGDDDVRTVQTSIGTATMTVTAECPTDGVTEIRLYQNGKLVETTRNLVVEDDNAADKSMTKTFQLTLVAGANRFRAMAFNTQRTESKPVEMNVQYKPQQAGHETPATKTGIQLHVIVVGINQYKNPKYNLNYAQADAEAFKNGLAKGAEGIYSAVNMHYVQNADASRDGITGALNKVKNAAKAEDVFVFYYAGHGVMNDRKEFYLVPFDVTQLYGNDGALAEKGLSAASLQQFSKDIKAQKQLYILDACQSAGALDNIVALRGAAEEKAIAQLARSTGTHWLTASGSSQFASEFAQIGHGAFTYCLLEAFKGKADNGDKKITVREMDAYLQNRVPEVTQQYRGAVQYPSSYGYGNDFPLIIVR